jgi:hypothetical protein
MCFPKLGFRNTLNLQRERPGAAFCLTLTFDLSTLR